MMSASLNITLPNETSSYDTQGAIMYMLVVIIWYAIGFGLILMDDISPQPGHIKSLRDINVYQADNDLHEQKARNDLLMELKNKDKRKKMWDIYYGKEKNPSLTIEKDKKNCCFD